jgi:Xaa-Pro aminopeptidase
MFQTFEPTTRPEQGPPRLAALRELMRARGLDGFLVPRADAHQGETVAPRDERLAWLTGFTGSAGIAVVLAERAALFVDGRYRLQGRSQTADEIEIVAWPATKVGSWLLEVLPGGGRIGFDPWLHTESQIAEMREATEAAGLALCSTENLVDRIWEHQPAPPCGAIRPLSLEIAGETSADKRARLAESLRRDGVRAAVLTLPDSIAWLLNIRGSDVARTPVPHAFAILHDDARADLFVAPAKIEGLALEAGVTPLPPAGFVAALTHLSAPVLVDRETAPVAVGEALREADVEIVWGRDPCVLPKARKNSAELASTAEAHLRDAAAMVRFLAWLDDGAPSGSLTEIDVVTALERFRRQTDALDDISFETIAGAGPNGAIVHYRVTTETNRPIEPGLLLVDSGGQYGDGTTDVTRTVCIGPPEPEHVACFTRVLRGMIGLSTLRWPAGLAGRDIDAVARAPLWRAGLDYDHGTGHGVGVCLGVHEGPQRISRLSEVPLEPGMILSNEPGYYRDGAFGIRIENLVVVEDAPRPEGGDDRRMLRFRTLTFVPIDRRLIDPALMAPDELSWLDAYHAEIRDRVGPRVDGAARTWLDRATAPLSAPPGGLASPVAAR